MVTLSRDDPWDNAGSFVASYHEGEIAKYKLNEPDSRMAEWRATDCRAQLCAAERELRSDAFRLEEGLKPWGLLVGMMGPIALTDDDECSPLHWAARNGAWYALPEKALTPDAMLIPNLANESPFEIAARNNNLQQIEAGILTRLVTSCTRIKDTPLHHAARNGYLLHLPQAIKTDELLALENSHGCTVFELHCQYSRAAGHGANHAA